MANWAALATSHVYKREPDEVIFKGSSPGSLFELFFVKKIHLSRGVGYVMDGSMSE